MGYQVSIPGRPQIFVGIFLLAWLGGWTVGGSSALQNVLQSWQRGHVEWFLVFWLIGWLLGELSVIAVLGYMAAGKEIITLEPGHLTVRLAVLGAGRSWQYENSQIKRLRIAAPLSGRQQWSGTIAFDYGASTIRFARDIEEAEAGTIIAELIATGLLSSATAA
jgi:hypothetical protein